MAGETAESFDWTLVVTEAENVTMSHVHIGNATTSGNVVLNVEPTGDEAAIPVAGTSLVQFEEPKNGDLEFK